MTLRSSLALALTTLAVGALICLPPTLNAQAQPDSDSQSGDGESYVRVVGGGMERLPLGLPPLEIRSSNISESADLLRSVARNDLTLSGYFDILDDGASLEPATAGARLGDFDFDH